MDKDEGALKLVQTTHQHHSTISLAHLTIWMQRCPSLPFFTNIFREMLPFFPLPEMDAEERNIQNTDDRQLSEPAGVHTTLSLVRTGVIGAQISTVRPKQTSSVDLKRFSPSQLKLFLTHFERISCLSLFS
jgi:hypothetical protein